MYEVSTFYSLAPLDLEVRRQMQQTLETWPGGSLPLRGLVLLAPDGINATIAGQLQDVEAIEQWLGQNLPLSRCKRSRCQEAPFRRWKIQLRRETITSGPMAQGSGPSDGHLSPEEWHQMLQREDVLVLDVRNDYEVKLGKFRGAINPQTRNFTEFADFAATLAVQPERPVLAYCTGGIRCEKAVPYLKARGLKQVYQLEGGILHYLERFPDGAFEGDCFVFDDRIALNSRLEPTGRHQRCPECGQPGPQGEPCCH